MAEPSLPARWDAAKELFAILSTSGTARSPPKTPECEAGAHFDEVPSLRLSAPNPTSCVSWQDSPTKNLAAAPRRLSKKSSTCRAPYWAQECLNLSSCGKRSPSNCGRHACPGDENVVRCALPWLHCSVSQLVLPTRTQPPGPAVQRRVPAPASRPPGHRRRCLVSGHYSGPVVTVGRSSQDAFAGARVGQALAQRRSARDRPASGGARLRRLRALACRAGARQEGARGARAGAGLRAGQAAPHAGQSQLPAPALEAPQASRVGVPAVCGDRPARASCSAR